MGKKVVRQTRSDGVTQGYHVGSDEDSLPTPSPDIPEMITSDSDKPVSLTALIEEDYARFKAEEEGVPAPARRPRKGPSRLRRIAGKVFTLENGQVAAVGTMVAGGLMAGGTPQIMIPIAVSIFLMGVARRLSGRR